MANNDLPTDPTITAPPTGVVEQPTPQVEQAPVQQEKVREEGLTQTMGDLPQWRTILQDNKYRLGSSGYKNRARESWLKGISSLNPNMDKAQYRDLRSQVYQSDHNDYRQGDWNKTTAEEHLGEAVGAVEKKFGQEITPTPDTKLPTDIEGAGKVVKKVIPSERIGVTKFEKYIAKTFNKGMDYAKKYGQHIPIVREAMLIGKGTDELIKKLPEIGNQIDEELNRQTKYRKSWEDIKSTIDKTIATSDYVMGGMKGATLKEQRKARAEGRHKYYRELPTNSRIKKLQEMIENPDEFMGMPDAVKDMVLDEMLPKGYSLKEIDQFIFQAIANKSLPEVGFYYGMGKDYSGWDALKNPLSMLAMGFAGVPGFDHKAGSKAFWEGIVEESLMPEGYKRKHVVASDVRKQLKGATYEEQYGLLKGTLANVGLTILGDPFLWADLGSNKAKRVVKAGMRLITGQAGLKESRITMEMLIKLSGKDMSKPYMHQAKNVVDDMLKYLNDPQFKRTMGIMDNISDKFQKIPSSGKLKALVDRTQGTKLPALLQERFGRVEDIITDIHKVAQLDDAGKLKQVADVKAVKELPTGRAIPLKGDKATPMLGDVKPTRTIALAGDVADTGTQVGAPFRQVQLPPARLATGKLTEGVVEGAPRVTDDLSDVGKLSNVVQEQSIVEKGAAEVGEAVKDKASKAMDDVTVAASEGKMIKAGEVGRAGTHLEGTIVKDAQIEALGEFLAKGEQKIQDQMSPLSSTIRKGQKYKGEAKDTAVGALEEMEAILKRGTVKTKGIDEKTGELVDKMRPLTEPETVKLKKTVTGLKADVKGIKAAEKADKGATPLTKTEKDIAALDAGVVKTESHQRKVIVKQNEEGGWDILRKFGSKWKKTGELNRNPNGEYLGSIFGQAQKFYDSRIARRRAGKSAAEEFNDTNKLLKESFISIEKQFENAPVVGKAVKNMYSSKDAIQEHGLMKMKEIAGQSLTKRWSKLTADDMIDLPLLREDKKLFAKLTPAEQERVQPILKQIDDFLEDYKKAYKDRGIDVDFKEHIRDKWIKENKSIQETMLLIKSGNKTYVGKRDLVNLGIEYTKPGYNPRNMKEVRKILSDNYFNNEKMIAEIKNFEYVPIPHAQWFETGYDKLAFAKGMKLANTQGRKTFRIQDLIDSGAIRRDQVNLMDMLAAYTQRASHDLPMLDVKIAMKKSGLAFDMADYAGKPKGALRAAIQEAKTKGWKKPDARHFPMWGKTYMHQGLWDWLYHFKYEQLNKTKFDSFMSHVKVWQFANPFFLPYYDMMQGIVARGPLGAINPVGIGRDMAWAVKMMKNRPREYWELMHAGLQSKPMAMPFNQWLGQIEKLKNTNAGGYLWQLTKETVGTAGLRPIYEASWNTAWSLDKLVRLSTAKYMMRKGMSTFDAAQFSALIHSDYANVPMKFRRTYNRAFFTPTFKITMFRLYKEMMKNMLKVPLKKVTGRGAELSLQEKQLAKAGLTTVLGAMVGMDVFLQSKGYIRDQFARRYYKNVMNEKGEMKEDVIVFSSPLTMVPKYAYKLDSLVKENYRDNKFMQAFDSFKWDIHPVWRVSMDIAQNRKDNGDKIWQPFGDSDPMKAVKIAEYAAVSALAIIRQIGLKDEPDDQKEAWDLYKKDMGYLFATISSPTTFAYLRDPKVIRYVKKLQRLQRDWKRAITDAAKEGTYNVNIAINGQKKIIRATEDLKKAIAQAEKINDQATWNRWKREQNKRAQ